MVEVASPIYKVKTGGFEGPLGLLLSLIESRKLFISDVSLAEVTDDYMAYVGNLTNLASEKKIADISYFILIASTLILIKSKSLLPNLELTEDEEQKITDLEKRLKLYQIIKQASVDIKNNFGLNIIFYPNERIWNEPLFSPDSLIGIDNMVKSIASVLANQPIKTEKLPELEVKKIINLNEVIDNLVGRIENAMNVSFREFASSHGAKNKEEAKIHIIVSFLAMLELVRGGIIDVVQNTSFGDIKISKQEIINQ
jgi:segregation and condensation protein A